MPTSYIELYFPVLVQVVIALGLAAGLIGVSALLGKRAKSPQKDTPYESGMMMALGTAGAVGVLAMMLCCSANRASSAPSIARATAIEPSAPESIDFGTPKFPRNPIAYKKVAKNTP